MNRQPKTAELACLCCNGSGKVTIIYVDGDLRERFKEVDCNKCNGTGKITVPTYGENQAA